MDGLLLIDKSPGMTSHDVVYRCRKILKRKDIGHSGTLDPFASGLMILLVGEATKVSNYVTSCDKSYEALVRLGGESSTLDKTGEIHYKEGVNSPSMDEVLKALQFCQGEENLEIPLYSAKKINGKKLCDLAREGKSVDLPKKIMKFYNLELVEYKWPLLRVNLSCSKGSFIRSWAQWLGRELGTGAYLQELRRTQTSDFSVNQALTLDDLEDHRAANKEMKGLLWPVAGVVEAEKTVTIKGKDQVLLRNGQVSFDLRRRLIGEEKAAQKLQKVRRIKVLSYPSRQMVAMLEASPTKSVKIKRIFNFAKVISS